MKFRLEFDCDNAAFEDGPVEAVGDVLASVRRSFVDHGVFGRGMEGFVRDANGNTIGSWRIK